MDYRQEAQKWGAKAYEILMAEELRRQDEIKREKELANNPETFIDKANKGDVDAILKLKEFAKDGNEKAKDALEKLYWDGNKKHAVGTVVIRDGLTSIGKYAFSGYTALTQIVLPDSLTEIGSWAFSGCTALTQIVLPDSLTSIDERVFDGCTALKEILLPEGLTSIGDVAFSGCTSLTQINLPEGLTSIGFWAFDGCKSLKKITYSRKIERRLKEIFGDDLNRLEKNCQR